LINKTIDRKKRGGVIISVDGGEKWLFIRKFIPKKFINWIMKSKEKITIEFKYKKGIPNFRE